MLVLFYTLLMRIHTNTATMGNGKEISPKTETRNHSVGSSNPIPGCRSEGIESRIWKAQLHPFVSCSQLPGPETDP